MKISIFCHGFSWLLLVLVNTVVVRAWSNSRKPRILEKSSVASSAGMSTTRKEFWTRAGISLGILGILSVPESARAAPSKKVPAYIQERGSLESGLSPCPGQPAKKCCWSTEDTQGRRVLRWEAPAAIQGNSKAMAKELEDVVAAYPQEGQNDVDRGGWIQADRKTDSGGKATYLRYEFTSGKFKYIDELEMLVDATGKVSVRTSSRSAGFDYNVNGTRLNYIQKSLEKKGWKVKMV